MKAELLAPAGNLEKLKFAVQYGADAVYFGVEFGSLRSFAGNFSFEDAKDGLKYLHERGRKGYVALNIYPYSEEYDRIVETAKRLDGIGVDAFIVSDVGVIDTLRGLGINAAIHISTQANTTNSAAVRAYGKLGARRVNLARELSFERIEQIQKEVGGEVETEVFIHGSVCFSYSGRCAISDYLTGFGANRGECKHPCRWKYHLVEEKRPGEYMPVFEDDRGLYFFNSKELALFEYVHRLSSAGVRSFKIEGRMKSVHYIATVVSFYRQVIDGKNFGWEEGLELLNRVPNRGYSRGFMKGGIGEEDYRREANASGGGGRFVGNVLEQGTDSGSVVEVRNTINAGERLELLEPDGSVRDFVVSDPLVTDKGERVEFANNSQFIVLPERLRAYSILRRVDKK